MFEEFGFGLDTLFDASEKQSGNLPLYVSRVHNTSSNNNNNSIISYHDTLCSNGGGAISLSMQQLVSTVFPLWNDETFVLLSSSSSSSSRENNKQHNNNNTNNNDCNAIANHHKSSPSIVRSLFMKSSSSSSVQASSCSNKTIRSKGDKENEDKKKKHDHETAALLSSPATLSVAPLEPIVHNFGPYNLAKTFAREQTHKDSSSSSSAKTTSSASSTSDNNTADEAAAKRKKELLQQQITPFQQMRQDCQNTNIKISGRLMTPNIAELRQLLIKYSPAVASPEIEKELFANSHLEPQNNNNNNNNNNRKNDELITLQLPHFAVSNPEKYHPVILERLHQTIIENIQSEENGGSSSSPSSSASSSASLLLSLLHALVVCRSHDIEHCATVKMPDRKIDNNNNTSNSVHIADKAAKKETTSSFSFPVDSLTKIIDSIILINNSKSTHSETFSWTDIRKISSSSSSSSSTTGVSSQQTEIILASPKTGVDNNSEDSSSSDDDEGDKNDMNDDDIAASAGKKSKNNKKNKSSHHDENAPQVLIRLPFYHAKRIGVHSINCKNCIIDLYANNKHVEFDGNKDSSSSNNNETTNNQENDEDDENNNTANSSSSHVEKKKQHAASFSPGSGSLVPKKPASPKTGSSARPHSATTAAATSYSASQMSNNNTSTITTTTHPNFVCHKGTTTLTFASRDGSCSLSPSCENPPSFSAVIVARGQTELMVADNNNNDDTSNNNSNHHQELRQVLLLLLINELRNVTLQSHALEEEKEKSKRHQQEKEEKKQKRALSLLSSGAAAANAADGKKENDNSDTKAEDDEDEDSNNNKEIFSEKQIFDVAVQIQAALQKVLTLIEKLVIRDDSNNNNNNNNEEEDAQFATLVAHAIRKYLLDDSITRSIYMSVPNGFRIDNSIVKLVKWIAKFALPSFDGNNKQEEDHTHHQKAFVTEKDIIDDENNNRKTAKEILDGDNNNNDTKDSSSSVDKKLFSSNNYNEANNNNISSSMISTSHFVSRSITRNEACSAAFLALIFSETLPLIFVQDCFDELLSPILLHLLPSPIKTAASLINNNNDKNDEKNNNNNSNSNKSSSLILNRNSTVHSMADLLLLEAESSSPPPRLQEGDDGYDEDEEQYDSTSPSSATVPFWKTILDLNNANDSLSLLQFRFCKEGHRFTARLSLPPDDAASANNTNNGGENAVAAASSTSPSSSNYSKEGIVCDECYVKYEPEQVNSLCLPFLHCPICETDVCVRCMAKDIERKKRDEKIKQDFKTTHQEPSILDLKFANRSHFVNPLIDGNLLKISCLQSVLGKSGSTKAAAKQVKSALGLFASILPTSRPSGPSAEIDLLRSAIKTKLQWFPIGPSWFLNASGSAPKNALSLSSLSSAGNKNKNSNKNNDDEKSSESSSSSPKFLTPSPLLLHYYEIPNLAPRHKMYLVPSLTDPYCLAEIENTTATRQTVGLGVVWRKGQWHWFSTLSGFLVKMEPFIENQIEVCRLSNTKSFLSGEWENFDEENNSDSILKDLPRVFPVISKETAASTTTCSTLASASDIIMSAQQTKTRPDIVRLFPPFDFNPLQLHPSFSFSKGLSHDIDNTNNLVISTSSTLTPYHFLIYTLRASALHLNSTCEREITPGETFGKMLEPLIKSVASTLAAEQEIFAQKDENSPQKMMAASRVLKHRLIKQSHATLLFETLLPLLRELLTKCNDIEKEARKAKESAALMFENGGGSDDANNKADLLGFGSLGGVEGEDEEDDRWRPDSTLVETLLSIQPSDLEDNELETLCEVLADLLHTTKKKSSSTAENPQKEEETKTETLRRKTTTAITSSSTNDTTSTTTTPQKQITKVPNDNDKEQQDEQDEAEADNASPAAKLQRERNARTRSLLSSSLPEESRRNFNNLLTHLWKGCSEETPLRARPTLLAWRVAEDNKATIQQNAPNSVTTSREECAVFGNILPPGTWSFGVRLHRPESPLGMRLGNLYLVGVCDSAMVASINLSNQHTHGFWLRRKDIYAIHDDSPQQPHATTISTPASPAAAGPHFFCGDTLHIELSTDGTLSFSREAASASSIARNGNFRRSAGDRSGEDESKRTPLKIKFSGLSPLKRYRPFIFLYNAGVTAVIEGTTSIAQTLTNAAPFKSLRSLVITSETIAESALRQMKKYHFEQQELKNNNNNNNSHHTLSNKQQMMLARNLLTLAGGDSDSWKLFLQSSKKLCLWLFESCANYIIMNVDFVNVMVMNESEENRCRELEMIKKTVQFTDSELLGVAMNVLNDLASLHPELFVVTPSLKLPKNKQQRESFIDLKQEALLLTSTSSSEYDDTINTNNNNTNNSNSNNENQKEGDRFEYFQNIKRELMKRVKALAAAVGETDGFSPRPERDASVVHGTIRVQQEASEKINFSAAYEVSRTSATCYADFNVFEKLFSEPLRCAKCDQEFDGVHYHHPNNKSSLSSSSSSSCNHELPKYSCEPWLWNRKNVLENTLSDTWTGSAIDLKLNIPDDTTKKATEETSNNNNTATTIADVGCEIIRFGRFAAKCVRGVRDFTNPDSIALTIEIDVETETEIEAAKKKKKKMKQTASWGQEEDHQKDQNDDDTNNNNEEETKKAEKIKNKKDKNKKTIASASAPSTTATTTTAAASLPPQPWNCPQCTFINQPHVRACEMCLFVPDDRLPPSSSSAGASPVGAEVLDNHDSDDEQDEDGDEVVLDDLLRGVGGGSSSSRLLVEDEEDNEHEEEQEHEEMSPRRRRGRRDTPIPNRDENDDDSDDDDENSEARNDDDENDDDNTPAGPPPGYYSCAVCTYFNPDRRQTCEMCGTKKKDDEPSGKITLRCQKGGHLHHALPNEAFSILPLPCTACGGENAQWSIVARDKKNSSSDFLLLSSRKNKNNNKTAAGGSNKKVVEEMKKLAKVELKLTVMKNGCSMEGSMTIGGQPHQVRLTRTMTSPTEWSVLSKKYVLGSVAAQTASSSEIVSAINAALKDMTECTSNPMIFTNRLRSDVSCLRRIALDVLRSIFSQMPFEVQKDESSKNDGDDKKQQQGEKEEEFSTKIISPLQEDLNREITEIFIHAGDFDEKIASRLISLVDPAAVEQATVCALVGLDASPYHNRRLSNLLSRLYEARVQAAQAQFEEANNNNNNKKKNKDNNKDKNGTSNKKKKSGDDTTTEDGSSNNNTNNNKPHPQSNWQKLLSNSTLTKISQLSMCDPVSAALEAMAAVRKFEKLSSISSSASKPKKSAMTSSSVIPKQLQDLLCPDRTQHRLRLQLAMMEYDEVFKIEKTPLFYLMKYFETVADQQQYEEMIERQEEQEEDENQEEIDVDNNNNEDNKKKKLFYVDPVPDNTVTSGLRIELGDGDPSVLRFGKAIGPVIPSEEEDDEAKAKNSRKKASSSSSRYYFESTCSDPGNCPGAFGVGDSVFVRDHTSTHVGGVRSSIGHNFKGEVSMNGGQTPYPIRDGAANTSLQIFPTTVVGCLVDLKKKNIKFSINGVEGEAVPIPASWTYPLYPVFSTSKDCHMHVSFENFRHCPEDAESVITTTSSSAADDKKNKKKIDHDGKKKQGEKITTTTTAKALSRENDDDYMDDAHVTSKNGNNNNNNDEEIDDDNNENRIPLVENCSEVSEKIARIIDGLVARNYDSQTISTKMFQDKSIAEKILDICMNQLTEHWEQLPSELTLIPEEDEEGGESHHQQQQQQQQQKNNKTAKASSSLLEGKENNNNNNNNQKEDVLTKYSLFFRYLQLGVNISALLIRSRPSAYQLCNKHKRFYINSGRSLLLAVDQLAEVESLLRTIGNRSRGKVIDVDIRLEDAVQHGFFRPIYAAMSKAPNAQWLLQDPARFPKFDRATDAGGPAREAWSQAAQNVMQGIGTDILVPVTVVSSAWLSPSPPRRAAGGGRKGVNSHHPHLSPSASTQSMSRAASRLQNLDDDDDQQQQQSKPTSPISPQSPTSSKGFPAAATATLLQPTSAATEEDDALSLNRIFVPNLFSTADSSSSKLTREEREKHFEFFGKMIASSYINKGSISIPIPMSRMIFMFLSNETIKIRDYEIDHGKVLFPKHNNNANNHQQHQQNNIIPSSDDASPAAAVASSSSPSPSAPNDDTNNNTTATTSKKKKSNKKNKKNDSNSKEYDLSVISKLRLQLTEEDARKELPANATTKDIIEYCCVHQYDEELRFIKKGFTSVCPPDAPVTSFALRRRIMGEPFTVENTLRHLDLGPLPLPLRTLFVDIISTDFDEDQRSKIFQFGCGQAVIPLPDRKKLTIADSGDSLCRASTCAYQMSIPRSTDRAELRRRILNSLSAGIGGFGNI